MLGGGGKKKKFGGGGAPLEGYPMGGVGRAGTKGTV